MQYVCTDKYASVIVNISKILLNKSNKYRI